MQHLEEGILHELLDGEIPSSDLPPIRAHLAACPECRARLEEAREFAGAADQLIETIELTEQTPSRDAVVPPRPPVRRWGRDLAWAASLVMAVGAGYLARGSGRPAAPTTGDSAAPAPAAAPVPADTVQDRATPSASRPEAGSLDRPATPESRTDERERRANAPAPLAQRKTGAKEGAAASPDTAKRRMEDARFALDEIVTTGVPIKAAASAQVVGKTAAPEAAAPPPAAPPAARGARVQLQAAPAANELRLDEEGKVSVALKREAAAPMEISFPEALRRLSGTLRLIEGLVPVRLEALGAEVRIIYPLSSGELALEQWLGDGRVNYRLVAPRDFPTDSLERLRARVRE